MGLSAASRARRVAAERARRRLHRKRVHAGHLNAIRGENRDDAAEFVERVCARVGLASPDET